MGCSCPPKAPEKGFLNQFDKAVLDMVCNYATESKTSIPQMPRVRALHTKIINIDRDFTLLKKWQIEQLCAIGAYCEPSVGAMINDTLDGKVVAMVQDEDENDC